MNTQGLILCTRYAFPPNALHYCGPEKQSQVLAYQSEQIADEGLSQILKEFETLFPYLTLIAHENNMKDPFDPRVVEAYWIGNNLLNNVSMKNFYKHFVEALNLKKRIKRKDFELLVGKFDTGALPHHAFHVLNVFTRTGHHTVKHTLETMDSCRISWGTIVDRQQSTTDNQLLVKTQPLTFQNKKLVLGKPIVKNIQITTHYMLHDFNRTNQYITFHWNNFCDTITKGQAFRLKYYTNLAIALANKTI